MEYNKIHQGERLMILVKRSKLKQQEVAAALDVHPSYLSRIYHSQKLTKPIVDKSILLFGIQMDYFTSDSFDLPPDVVQEYSPKMIVKKGPESAVLNHLDDVRNERDRLLAQLDKMEAQLKYVQDELPDKIANKIIDAINMKKIVLSQ